MNDKLNKRIEELTAEYTNNLAQIKLLEDKNRQLDAMVAALREAAQMTETADAVPDGDG